MSTAHIGGRVGQARRERGLTQGTALGTGLIGCRDQSI